MEEVRAWKRPAFLAAFFSEALQSPWGGNVMLGKATDQDNSNVVTRCFTMTL